MTKILHFSKKIINWYKIYGRKTLPWQITTTPYTIWISEIMLQQTQMIRVIPYFQRFIYKFPNIKKLANAQLDTVLHLWSGLGYYTRAHNLHKTAKIIANEYNTIFPENLNTLITFPGIGRSTAGAILSLSLKKRYPILESNVKRILTRYYTIHGYTKTIEKKLWNLINNLLPKTNILEFNQGLMDLGEIICTITNPKCHLCPLENSCQANIKNITYLYPNKKSQIIIQKKNKYLLILRYKHKIWIKRCPINKIWGGLFAFPQFTTENKLHDWILKYRLHLYTNRYERLPNFQHKFTRYSINFTPIIINLTNIPTLIKTNNKQNSLWFNLNKPKIIGFPQPMIQLLKIMNTNNNTS